MKIFIDEHHADLRYSLQLLFEKRLGWELYRPIGMEWWEKKYWAVWNHPDTAKQFLSTDQAINLPKDVHGEILPSRARMNANYTFKDGIYYVMDPTKDKIVRGITFDTFKDMKFDIMLSSIPQHIPIFNELIAKYQPQAKHIFQVGNAWGHLPGVKNILASTAPFNIPSGVNACFYHQEFDLDVYKYQSPDPTVKKIRSFIHYMRQMDLHTKFKTALPEFSFTTHGAGMEEDLCRTDYIAQAYKDCAFAWHVKPEGDGFGYGGHCPFACGRPLITIKQYYRGKLAEALMIDKETCIDIGSRTLEESVQLIRKYSQPEEHLAMCERAYSRFKQIVDFDQEEKSIQKFLAELK